MASTLSHSAVFAAGLLIGVGSIVYSNQRSSHPTHSSHSDNQNSINTIPTNSVSSQQAPFQQQHFFSVPQAPSTSPSQSSSLKEILRFGNPGPISDFFAREAYAVGYDRRTRNPAWTAEHLTSSNLKASDGDDKPDRSHSTFHEDMSIPSQFRSKLSDYFRSGYDRGHMVPAADAKRSQSAMNQTFLLSNIAPQVGEGFNRDYWAHLEGFVRQLTNSFQDVYVFTLPMYLPKQDPVTKKQIVSYEVIGNPPNVAVPTHFAKVVFATGGKLDSAGKGVLGSFVLPNDKISNDQPLTSFEVPVESVERSAGLNLLPESVKTNPVRLCSTVQCDSILKTLSQITYNKPKKPAK
ncbi:nuclease [Puccinia graminis f. sp. tritici]|uniref:Endonuclease n=1 Tax=Puccinia graminis f. sp. tritici TaxID=56615 RepID=A0A5B0RQT5_PUCGR|nr:nuclease [Puccinia graminis f. sp. tritici]KAA1128336.1 nuclease [Puccinia graminis f. sp. tritici]